MGTKISELTLFQTITTSDYLPIVQNGVTGRVELPFSKDSANTARFINKITLNNIAPNNSAFNPTTNPGGASLNLSSSFGGGIVMRDGGYGGIWMQAFGTEMHFAVGNSSSLGSYCMKLDNNQTTSFGGSVNIKDNNFLRIGDGGDFYLKHNGVQSNLGNNTGHLFIANYSNSNDISFSNRNSLGVDKYTLKLGGATPDVRLYYDGNEKFRTQIDGGYFHSDASSIVYSQGDNGYGAFYAKGSDSNPAYIFMGNSISGELVRMYALISGGFSIKLNAGIDDTIQVDSDSTAGNTRLLIYDVDNGSLERVVVGAADSLRAGYKAIGIAN